MCINCDFVCFYVPTTSSVVQILQICRDDWKPDIRHFAKAIGSGALIINYLKRDV